MNLVDAVFINNGGGKVLLDYLIEVLFPHKKNIVFLLDKRVENIIEIEGYNITFIEPSIFKRHLFYIQNKKRFHRVFCFGNLPPTIKLDSEVITYLHQSLFLESSYMYPLREKILLFAKKKIFNALKNNTNFWFVQTENMKSGLYKKLGIPESKIILVPFFRPFANNLDQQIKDKHSYLYVSDGSIHKNHYSLIESFAKFQQKYPEVVLNLTVSGSCKELLEYISNKQKEGVNIVNHGKVEFEAINKLYQTSEFIVYPSLTEGFGMPILEAQATGRVVITSNIFSMPEVGGDAACYVDPFDINSIRSGIIKVINDENFRNDLIVRGLNNVKRFEPDKIASMYGNLYLETFRCNE